MNWDYQTLDTYIKRGRKPHSKRPWPARKNLTIVRRTSLYGEPRIAVQLYSTDIVTYHPDGTQEVATSWESVTTRKWINICSRASIRTVRIPAINGFAPTPNKVLVLERGGHSVPFEGVNGRITIRPDGTFDLDTVIPAEIRMITDPKTFRAMRSKAYKALDQVKARAKLGVYGNWDKDGAGQRVRVDGYSVNWLLDELLPAIDTPLEQLPYEKLRPFPNESYFNGARTYLPTALFKHHAARFSKVELRKAL